jgi:hypothetical protein
MIVLFTQRQEKRERENTLLKIDEAPKEVEEDEGGAHHSPQREFSPQPAPELEEVPSTKTTGKKGRKLLFPSPTVAVETRSRRPFTRSSTRRKLLNKNHNKISCQEEG